MKTSNSKVLRWVLALATGLVLGTWAGAASASGSINSNGASSVDPQGIVPLYPQCFGGSDGGGLTGSFSFKPGTPLWIFCGVNGGAVPTADFWFGLFPDGGASPVNPDGGSPLTNNTATPCYSGSVLRMAVPGQLGMKTVTMNITLNQALTGDTSFCVAPSAQ